MTSRGEFEILLRNNSRAGLAMTLVASLPLVFGLLWLAIPRLRSGETPQIFVVLAIGLTLVGAALSWTAWMWWRTPRLAADSQSLWVYLRPGAPIRVPIDVVECFFLGQAPGGVHDARGNELETRNVVVRLAERAVEWHRIDVTRVLGHWCDGYITVYGTWSEPLNREMVDRMNQQFLAIKRARKRTEATST